MKKKQRIPGYMKNDIDKKPKVKYIEIILDVMGKIPRILPLYLTALGAFHVFSWAFFISSGNIGDISFIIQKEGISGGISRILTLIIPHIMMLIIALIPNVILIMLVYLSLKFGTWVYRRTRNILNSKIVHFFWSSIPGFLFFILFLFLMTLVIRMLLNSNSANNFYFDKSFDYWIEPGNVITPILFTMVITFILHIIFIFFILNWKIIQKVLTYKIVLWVVIFFVSLSPFFMFSGAYSKGYGTECISLETEDNMIVGPSVGTGNVGEEKNILKISEVIQSGGGYIADILSEGKGNKNYVLSSYVYSEDKDYLNIMVFSVREWYKDNKGNTRIENDLLIDEKGGGRNGVLVSIKKSSIKNRFVSIPLCFNGK